MMRIRAANCQMKQKKLLLKKHTIIILAIGCAGSILRIWNINQSFWWDEIAGTMAYAHAVPLSDTISRLGPFFNNHALYSLVARFSLTLLGENEIALRLPALLMGILSIPMLFLFGKTFAGSRQGVIGAGLLAVSAVHIDHSMSARGYSGLALLALLSSYCFLKALRTNAKSTWTYYVLWNILGVYMHICMAAVIGCQLAFTVYLSLGRASRLPSGVISTAVNNAYICLALALSGTLLVYSPTVYRFLASPAQASYVLNEMQRLAGSPELPAFPFLLDYFKTILPGIGSIYGSILSGVLIVCGFLFLYRQDRTVFLYLLGVTCLPLLVAYALKPAYITERYFIFMLPLLLLVIGCGIAYLPVMLCLPQRYVFTGMLMLLAGFSALQFPQIVETVTEDRQNYREAAGYLNERLKANRNDCVVGLGYGSSSFQYYLDAPLIIPETFEAFAQLLHTRDTVWCVTSAWLPAIHPAHEDRTLYREMPEHEKIYAHLKTYHIRIKCFPTRYPTEIFMALK